MSLPNTSFPIVGSADSQQSQSVLVLTMRLRDEYSCLMVWITSWKKRAGGTSVTIMELGAG